jgi:hypothetical protein
VNDEIATRRNDRQLVTDRGEMVRNRATWTVTAIHPNGSLTASGHHGTVRLPARYIADHVELAYASTAAAAQGRTVDHALMVVDRPTDVRNLYVAMSRGSHANHAYLAIQGEQTAQDIFVQCLVSDWIDQPAHTRRAELAGQQAHRAGLLDGTTLRSLLERRNERASELELARARQQRLPGEIRHTQTEKDTAERTIADLQQRQRQAQDLIAEYDRPLRRHRHQADITNARQVLADVPHRLHPAQRTLTAANDTLADLDEAAGASRAVMARRSDIEGEIGDLDHRINHDLHIRTRVTRREQPEAILAVLGPRPGFGQDPRAGTPLPVASPNTTPPSTSATGSARNPTVGTAPHTVTATKQCPTSFSRSAVASPTDRSSDRAWGSSSDGGRLVPGTTIPERRRSDNRAIGPITSKICASLHGCQATSRV